MDRRYKDILQSRFDDLEDKGFTVVTPDELKRWYERERITKTVWQDIEERWKERDDETPVMVGDNPGGWTLIYARGLTAEKNAWFRPIAELSQSSE